MSAFRRSSLYLKEEGKIIQLIINIWSSVIELEEDEEVSERKTFNKSAKYETG